MSSTFSIDGRFVTYNLFNTYKWAKNKLGEKPTAGAYPPVNALYDGVFHPPGLIFTNLAVDTAKQISEIRQNVEVYGVNGGIELKEVNDPVVGQLIDYLVSEGQSGNSKHLAAED